MMLEVDQRSAVPPYEQIRQQVTDLVRARVLAPGDRLPAIRQLSNDLGLASGTVARAYRELEVTGLVTTHGRHGTVISHGAAPTADPPKPFVAAARRLADHAIALGVSLDETLSAVRAAYTSGESR